VGRGLAGHAIGIEVRGEKSHEGELELPVPVGVERLFAQPLQCRFVDQALFVGLALDDRRIDALAVVDDFNYDCIRLL